MNRARWVAASLLVAWTAVLGWRRSRNPSKPIRIVMPFPTGGSLDIVSRLIGAKLTETWKVPVLVESRPGANTMIAAEHVAKSAPDGYTLLVCIESTLVMNQFLFAKMTYDPLKDFAPITLATTQPLVPGRESRARHQHRARPDRGGQGEAGSAVLRLRRGVRPARGRKAFTSMANVQMTGVAYKGAAPALQDVMSGNIALDLCRAELGDGEHQGAGSSSRWPSPARRAAARYPTCRRWRNAARLRNADVGGVCRAGRHEARRSSPGCTGSSRGLWPCRTSGSASRPFGAREVVASQTPDEFARLISTESAKFERAIKAAGIKVQ